MKLLFHGFLVPLPKFTKSIGIKRNQDMKKELKGKELKKFYEDHVDEVAFEMEEAFLNVLHRRGPEYQKPGFILGSLAMAVAHVLYMSEKLMNYQIDFKKDFNGVLMDTYNYYKENHIDDEEDMFEESPDNDSSKLN